MIEEALEAGFVAGEAGRGVEALRFLLHGVGELGRVARVRDVEGARVPQQAVVEGGGFEALGAAEAPLGEGNLLNEKRLGGAGGAMEARGLGVGKG